MDEIAALKLIFQNDFVDEETITFNGRNYSYSEFQRSRAGPTDCFFSFIMRREEETVARKESGPQFDTLVNDVKRITDEQFAEWKKNRRITQEQKAATGKAIWLEQKRRGVAESHQDE